MIGERRERPVIQEAIENVDSEGNPVESWIEVRRVWASVNVLSATEFPEMFKPNIKAVAEFEMNYYTDVTEKMRIQWRDEYWNINGLRPMPNKLDMTILASRIE